MRAALAIRRSARTLGLEVRVSLHTGGCEVLSSDLVGIAVHLTARVRAKARAGEVLASSTVRDLVMGSRLELEDRGRHLLRGVPGGGVTYGVADDVEARWSRWTGRGRTRMSCPN